MSENLTLGLTLLAMGMGFVLCFLCILIAAMYSMSAIVIRLNKIFPEQIEIVERKSNKTNVKEDEAIAVALAAIMAKR